LVVQALGEIRIDGERLVVVVIVIVVGDVGGLPLLAGLLQQLACGPQATAERKCHWARYSDVCNTSTWALLVPSALRAVACVGTTDTVSW
jgi:hypothetical protein